MLSFIPPPHINNFLQKALEKHDLAHDISHAWRAYTNAVKIVNSENIPLTPQEQKEFPLVILCHDVLDHKLKETSLPERDVMKFYVDCVGVPSAVKIDYIHKNCSWSNRKTSVPLVSGDWMRKVLQDADWLDALGEYGLQRCIVYSRSIHPEYDEFQIKERVKAHIQEKLLHIPSELNYETSKKMVIDGKLLEPLLEYLKS